MPRRKIYSSSLFFDTILMLLLSCRVCDYAWTMDVTSFPWDTENRKALALPHHVEKKRRDIVRAILYLEAQMVEGGPIIKNGIIWRVFTTDSDDEPLFIVRSMDSSAKFILEPGRYIIHAAFGRAGVIKHVTLEAGEMLSEKIVLNAGGIKLNAVLPDGEINKNRLKFSIYHQATSNNEALIAQDVKPGAIVRLNAGVYHIVSNYGTDNAVVRSDIQIEAGKITEAIMQHRAAQITLKLVRKEGSEALANTRWAVVNDSGDVIREIANAYAHIILVEGDYIAIAQNRDKIYQKEFSVSSGKDEEIVLLTKT